MNNERIACLYLPEFALQVHRQAHAIADDCPFVIVDRDHPQGKIVARNDQAAQSAIGVGMRYAQALSLHLDLCAVPWDKAVMDRCQQALATMCLDHTPDVECHKQTQGVIWLFWSGLSRLFPCVESWAQAVLARVQAQGWVAHIAVGFGRRSSYAVAQCIKTSLWVAPNPAKEAQRARLLSVDRFGVGAKQQRALQDLGIKTLGDLQRLSASELQLRFGQALLDWHGFAKHIDWGLGTRVEIAPKIEASTELEHPVQRTDKLTQHIETLLAPMIERVRYQGNELAGLQIELWLQAVWDVKGAHLRTETVMLAAPSAHGEGLLRLIELRLQNNPPTAPVEKIDLFALVATRPKEQGVLWGELQTRDLHQGDKALAVIRAELGNDAVQQAVLKSEHLPEQRFGWKRLDKIQAPLAKAGKVSGLVRRIEDKARQFAAVRREMKAYKTLWGPHLIESDWWSQAVEREEYYMIDEQEGLRWMFFDKRQNRWFLQGWVGS